MRLLPSKTSEPCWSWSVMIELTADVCWISESAWTGPVTDVPRGVT